MHLFAFLLTAVLHVQKCYAQQQGTKKPTSTVAPANKTWNGKSCAVVITYDDAIDEHLDNAIPVLDSLNLKATFYLTAFSTSMQTRLNDWKKLSTSGHELGNHTLYHPCMGGQGREWVKPEYDLNNYTLKRMVDEVKMTNVFLEALDARPANPLRGKTKRTFAFTCGQMKVADSSFITLLKDDFVAARAVRNEMHQINEIDLYNVDCYLVNNHTGAQIIDWIKKAEATNSLLVILFHGVGGGNALDVSVTAHRQVLKYLQQAKDKIWVAPMVEVAEYIKAHQLNNSN